MGLKIRLPARYERAASVEPEDRPVDVTDDGDPSQPGRNAPSRRAPSLNGADKRRRRASSCEASAHQKGEPSRHGRSDVFPDRTALPPIRWSPPLLQSLRQRGMSIVARAADPSAWSSRRHDATWLDPPTLYRITRDGAADFSLWAAMEHTLSEHPAVRDARVLVPCVIERYLVDLGASLVDDTSGLHYTYVDPAHAEDPRRMGAQALTLVELFERKYGVGREKVVVSIPATEAGIRAAKALASDHGVRTNLTLVSNVAHASVCLEAGSSTLTVDHSKVLRGLKSWSARTESSPTENSAWKDVWALGAASIDIKAIAAYLRMHSPDTTLLVAEVRELEDLADLAAVGGVVVNARDCQRMAELRIRLRDGPDEDAESKARETPYPTTYLSHSSRGRLAVVPQSEKDRHVRQFVHYDGLRTLVAYQRKLVNTVRDILAHRIWVRDLDGLELEHLYLDDVYEEQQRQVEAEQAYLAGTPEEVRLPSHRTNHVGFRMANATWDVALKYAHSADEDTLADENLDGPSDGLPGVTQFGASTQRD